MTADVNARLKKANDTFWGLRPHVWWSKQVTRRVKFKVLRAVVLSILMYGSECWAFTGEHIRRMTQAYHCWLRIILGGTRRHMWKWHISWHIVVQCNEGGTEAFCQSP